MYNETLKSTNPSCLEKAPSADKTKLTSDETDKKDNFSVAYMTQGMNFWGAGSQKTDWPW